MIERNLREVRLREREPVARPCVLALQRERRESQTARIDPIVVLRVLRDVPGGSRPGLVHALGFVAQARGDRHSVGVRERLV